MSNEERVVGFECVGRTAVITLNRPDRLNAVNGLMADGLRLAMDRLERDEALLAGILTGAGERAFCAGMDLKAFMDGEAESIIEGEGGFAGLTERERSKPLIAAVNGAALGGGFEIVLACDLAVAVTGAVFGLPEVKVGLFPAAGGAIRLPRLIPRARALELMLTGEPMQADEALALGLLNRVVEHADLMGTALDLATRIGANAPLAVRETLALARRAALGPEKDLWELNARAWSGILGTRDAMEGPTAFKEKRAPAWKGR